MYKSEVKYFKDCIAVIDPASGPDGTTFWAYDGETITPLPYSEPSEEYIHTIKFMEQIKKDLESMCYYTFYNGDSGDESTKPVATMGAQP